MAKVSNRRPWPVLKHYDGDHLTRIALPLGGIGTGTVSLGGRGDLRDWEIVNRPAKGFTPQSSGQAAGPFFALHVKPAGGPAVTRALEGPIDPSEYEGAMGSTTTNHGLPRFRRCSFAAAYPFGQVILADPDVPVSVRLEAFNPLVPGDADASGIPVAVLRYVLTNRTGKKLTVAVCGSLPNFIGQDGSEDLADGNRNRFRKGKRVRGIFMDSKGVSPTAATWGTLALTTTATAGLSHRTMSAPSGWGNQFLDFWDDFSDDGILEPRKSGEQKCPLASLVVKLTLPPRATREVTFLITWHFPNRYGWMLGSSGRRREDRVGNYYATQYRDAWDVAEKIAPRLAGLERDTERFVRAFCESDLPEVVKEAALFNLAHLRTQTGFRIADGHFLGFEGCHDKEGCCPGSCTHVWNYEQAVAFLFGDLAKTMRQVEFAHATDRRGLMSFRVGLPLSRARAFPKAAADGQLGCLMKIYRDWQLSGDEEWLRSLWPKVRKALEFCWLKGGWDADRDGVMEGCQHNTMDVEYYGPNPQMGIWYLGALRAVEEMARHLGEAKFAATCRRLFENGRRWIDENLFNGEYYEHEIRPAKSADDVLDGVKPTGGEKAPKDPQYQLGPGCLVDQLVGQFMAHVCGLGYLVRPAHVRRTLRSIMKYNLRTGLHGHFNCMRSFALGDESALLMAAYPKDRPKAPFPYFTEVMTGFEYTAAVGMLYEGQLGNGLRCIRNIRDRYDGRKRSPFNEAECGHHYARSMASWAAVLALTGFRYSGVDKSITFGPEDGTHFWSNGRAWGTCRIATSASGARAELIVLHGRLELKRFAVSGKGEVELSRAVALRAGGKKTFRLRS